MLHIVDEFDLIAEPNLDVVHHTVDSVAMRLAGVQSLAGDLQRGRGGVEGSLRAPLLLHEPIGLGDQVLELAVELDLPEVDVVQPLADVLAAQRLGLLRARIGLANHTVRLPAILLAHVPVRERLGDGIEFF